MWWSWWWVVVMVVGWVVQLNESNVGSDLVTQLVTWLTVGT